MKILDLKITSCGECPYCLFGESGGDSWNCEHPESEVGIIVEIESYTEELKWPPIPEKCPLSDVDQVKEKIKLELSENELDMVQGWGFIVNRDYSFGEGSKDELLFKKLEKLYEENKTPITFDDVIKKEKKV